MTIIHVELYKYKIPLTTKLHLKDQVLSNREGLLIKLVSDSGQTGWGEVAPLPSFSKETLEQALNQLQGFLPSVISKPIPTDILRQLEPLHPSVRFGLESALLSIQAQIKSLPLRNLLNPTCSDRISVNALLAGQSDELINQLENKISNGFKTFKLKIGRNHIKDDLMLVEQICQLLPDDCSLRLDANRAYDYSRGLNLLKKLSGLNIEYIEEPFADLNDLKKYLYENNKPEINIALDETMVDLKPEQLMELKPASAVILKPTLLGFTNSMTLAKVAMELNMKPVISSSFESSLGLYALASMAAVIDDRIAVGLDTIDWLKDDSTHLPLVIENGLIDLNNHENLFEKVKINKMEVCLP